MAELFRLPISDDGNLLLPPRLLYRLQIQAGDLLEFMIGDDNSVTVSVAKGQRTPDADYWKERRERARNNPPRDVLAGAGVEPPCEGDELPDALATMNEFRPHYAPRELPEGFRNYQYPAHFTPAEEGGFVITFPDVPEAITQADTPGQCIDEATDALEEAIIGRINTGEQIPSPSARRPGQHIITVFLDRFGKSILRGLDEAIEYAQGNDPGVKAHALDSLVCPKLPRLIVTQKLIGVTVA